MNEYGASVSENTTRFSGNNDRLDWVIWVTLLANKPIIYTIHLMKFILAQCYFMFERTKINLAFTNSIHDKEYGSFE
jgi:hypothetical protein